jgi:hypothetical protein
MSRSWQRGCAILAAATLFSTLGLCVLLEVGIRARAIALPPVLVHNSRVWIGDRCRAYLNSPEEAERGCPPGYSVDVVIHETASQQYLLLTIPLQ